MKKLLFGILCLLLHACATVGSQNRPPSYYQDELGSEKAGLLGDSILGDNDARIKELLYYQIKLPKENRIAILKLSKDNYWRYYSSIQQYTGHPYFS